MKKCGKRATHRQTRPCSRRADHDGLHSWDLRRPVWTRTAVVAALKDWKREYGQAPRYEEWQSRQTSDRHRWPSPPTVIKYLKARNWSDALRKVGLEPHPPGGQYLTCENCGNRSRGRYCGTCRQHLLLYGEEWTPTEERRARRHEEACREIIADIQEWAARFGKPPRASDWNLAQARAQGHYDRVDRYHDTGRKWPSPTHVINHFGKWGDAIVAAGFPRPRIGKYERTPEVRARMANGQRRRRLREVGRL